MKQVNKLKHPNQLVTILILGMSILVFFAIGISYSTYNRKMNSALEHRLEKSLTDNTALAADIFMSDLISIADRLHDIVLPYEYDNSSGYNRDNLEQLIWKQNKQGNLGNLTLYSNQELRQSLDYPNILEEQRTHILKLLAGEEFVISYSENTASLSIAIPIFRHDMVDGILESSYPQKKWDSIFHLSSFKNSGDIALINSNGTVLIQQNAFNTNKQAEFFNGYSMELFSKDLSLKKAGGFSYKVDGKTNYAYYMPLGTSGLFVLNSVPSSLIDQDSYFFYKSANSLITTIIFAFWALIVFILSVQAFNNRKFKKDQNHLLIEKERYDTILAHSHGTIWEYKIGSDTLIKSDPNVGIYSGLAILPHFFNIFLDHNLVYPEDIPRFELFYKALRQGIQDTYTEIRGKDVTGEYVWFSLSGTTVFDHYGAPVSVIGQTMNIDKQKKELEELRDQSKRDPLTHLYNKTAIEELIDIKIKSESPGHSHAFYILNIDHFKNVNETYGRIFGDAVIIELSGCLSRLFKEDALLGRVGGDEFVLFVYNTPSMEKVIENADKIQHIFEEIYIGNDKQQVICGSLGISLYPSDGSTFEELFTKADIALYNAKIKGKNGYDIYKEGVLSASPRRSRKTNTIEDTGILKEDHSLIDSSIVSHTVDILFDARKLDSSINMILSMIGNYYSLGSIYIFEYNRDHTFINNTYSWSADHTASLTGSFYPMSSDDAEAYAYYKTCENGIFYTSDSGSMTDEYSSLGELLSSYQAKCFFQCGIYNQGNDQGCICAQIYDPDRSWSKPEIDSLTLLFKILGAYILKLRTEEKAKRIAERDALTDSYNFFQFIENASNLAEMNPGQTYAAVYMDINKFKFINDTYGYSEGDRILIEFANTLKSITESMETFGRISGDKFVALLKYSDKNTFLKRLHYITRQLNSIPKTENDYFKITIIFGIYIINESNNMSANFDRANIARKSIIDRHKTTYAFFDESMKSRLLKQKEIEDIMEEALKNEEFLVYYQPKFNLENSKICGAEALVRWKRPGEGIISPGDFIPIFEENGFIEDLDYYVFDHVCQSIHRLLDEGKHVVPISVNFSRVHLKDRSILSHLSRAVKDYNIPANLIEIEITESALVDNTGFIITLLNEIHSNGFRLSMDDFGSGLSSLNMLRTFPFDVLKIDKEFFQQGSSTERERVVITNVVKMANELKMDIVSEGVETLEQAEFLRSIHCTIAQGFLFEKPLAEEEYELKYC